MAARRLQVVARFCTRNAWFLQNVTFSSKINNQKRFICLSAALLDAQKLLMPALSPTMTHGTIVKWHKKEGDTISPGDILCEVETDKATVAHEVEEEGILAKILKPENSKDVAIGSVIALLVEEGEDWQNVEIPADIDADVSAAPSTDAPAAVATSRGSSRAHSHQPLGPAVRSLLEIYKIEKIPVKGTGPNGIITKGDLLSYIKEKNLQPMPPTAEKLPSAASSPPPPSTTPVTEVPPSAMPVLKPQVPPGEAYMDIELTNMRKVIAKRLTESKTTIPHSYATIDCDIGEVSKVRQSFIQDGVKVSVNDFIIKAAAVALKRVPSVNSVWTGEGRRQLANIDISVAVATDSGLITPIVTDAIGLGLSDISTRVKDLAVRAKEGKLKPEEFQGGSFTISNLGMFGITEFSAVINPPQSCILAIGGSRLVPGPDGEPQTRMMVTLSSDARIVDDFTAVQFLAAFRDAIENPMSMVCQPPPVNMVKDQESQFDIERLFAK